VHFDPDFNGNITSLSCASTSFCAGVDNADGTVFVYNGASWSGSTAIDPAAAAATAAVNSGSSQNSINMAVACPSASFCAVVDNAGNTVTFNGSTWSHPTTLFPANPSSQTPPLSCSTPSYCIVSSKAGYDIWNGSAWSAPARLPTAPASLPNGGFGQAACTPGTSFCMVLGAGSAGWGTFRGQTFAGASASARSPGQSFGLSCPTENFCMATGAYGDYATWRT
jgi:hypothetical protein